MIKHDQGIIPSSNALEAGVANPTPRQIDCGAVPKKKINTSAKGKAHEREVAAILEAQGYMIERARALYAWVNGRPMALRHDFFTCFDVIAVKNDIRFIQVTEWNKVSEKIKKINALKFPRLCEIWGRLGGRKAHYRVLHSAQNFDWTGGIEMVLRKPSGEKIG